MAEPGRHERQVHRLDAMVLEDDGFRVTCTCGWTTTGSSVTQLAEQLKAHRFRDVD